MQENGYHCHHRCCSTYPRDMGFFRRIIMNIVYKTKNYVALCRISGDFMLFLSIRFTQMIIMRDDGRGIRNLAVVATNHLGLFVGGLGKTKRPHCRCQNKTNSFEFTAMAVSICQLRPETVRNVYKYAYSNVNTCQHYVIPIRGNLYTN
jgi:hypothetical protein